MKNSLICILTISMTLFSVCAAAEILNGGFELVDAELQNPRQNSTTLTDFSDWEEIGNVYQTQWFYENSFTEGGEAVILSTSDYANGFSDSTIENWFGLDSGSIDQASGGQAYAGSAVKQTVTANSGDVLTFDWNFYRHEWASASENDLAFLVVDNVIIKIADINSSTFYDFDAHTGVDQTNFSTFSYTFESSGTHTIGFGVVDVGSLYRDGYLAIDDVKITPGESLNIGLIAYYPFESNADDASGNENHGAEYNGVSYIEGLCGQASKYDGIDDYIQVQSSDTYNPGNGDFTISIWAKIPSIPTDEHGKLIEMQGQHDGVWALISVEKDSGLPTFGMKSGTHSSQTVVRGPSLEPGKWYHLVGVRENSDTLKFYINADAPYSTTNSSLGNVDIHPGKGLFFGQDPRPDYSYFANATIDEARIYTRALSEEEILELYNEDCDGDGIPNVEDNCPNTHNPDQIDNDSDDSGDICDTDDDNDGILDTSDNCQFISNPEQEDNDEDLIGDVCDPDDDNDEILDENDNCPFAANTDQSDIDEDGLGDICDEDPDGDGVIEGDNCPWVPNEEQDDNDLDGEGDACDEDDDNDGILDENDNCPLTENPEQEDLDQDNIGDACDIDLDGDGVENENDNCPVDANVGQEDTDTDGLGDACDEDDDDDGILDADDNCSLIWNPDQLDFDEDGQGDACDGDLDGDDVANEIDNCPTVANNNQYDFDGDGLGDVCDDDIDQDGVPNNRDRCEFTELGEVVGPRSGCSIDQICPCEGPRGRDKPWRRHRQYVRCVKLSSLFFQYRGLITPQERWDIVEEARQSSCGRRW